MELVGACYCMIEEEMRWCEVAEDNESLDF